MLFLNFGTTDWKRHKTFPIFEKWARNLNFFLFIFNKCDKASVIKHSNTAKKNFPKKEHGTCVA